MDGVLNIDKPAGMTSHDVVLAVRRMAKEKRIGHTGTLDPLATGVLVLCLGKATRIARYLEAGEKEYQAVMRLGTTTDTLDADGRVLETRSYCAPSLEKIIGVMQEFTGTIMQSPPAYSAVKIGGVPSYKLARQGKAEPIKPRQVTIHRISLVAFEDPFVTILVRCSKGVYIRSLCADVGERLGMGAHLTSLKRTRSGRFVIDSAVTLERLASMPPGSWEQVLVPMDAALADFPVVNVSDRDSVRILHGNRLTLDKNDVPFTDTVRIHDRTGRLLSVARIEQCDLRPELVFSE